MNIEKKYLPHNKVKISFFLSLTTGLTLLYFNIRLYHYKNNYNNKEQSHQRFLRTEEERRKSFFWSKLRRKFEHKQKYVSIFSHTKIKLNNLMDFKLLI